MFSKLIKLLCCLCLSYWVYLGVGVNGELSIHPVSSTSFGAEITGVSLETLTNKEFDSIHDALLRHKVLVIRNQQDLSVEGQRLFSKRLGRLHEHLESSSHLPGYRDVNVVSNIKNSNGSYIGLYGKHVENFHSDLSWAHIPTKVTILKSVIRPDECGDTEFADSTAAYEALSDELKQQLEGKTGKYCYLKLREVSSDGKAENLDITEVQKAANCAEHPLISTHPITGRRNIYSNPSHTASVVGFSSDESEQLLQALFLHVDNPRFIYRHKYQDGDVVLWDNRAMHHRATGCPDEFPRKLVRTTVSNDHAPSTTTNASIFISEDGSEIYDLDLDRVNAEYLGVVAEGSAHVAEL